MDVEENEVIIISFVAWYFNVVSMLGEFKTDQIRTMTDTYFFRLTCKWTRKWSEKDIDETWCFMGGQGGRKINLAQGDFMDG